MSRWILFLLPFSLLVSCSSYNRITYINSEPSYHESTYESYSYEQNTIANNDNDYNIVSYDSDYYEVDSLEMENQNVPLVETVVDNADIDMEHKVVEPVLNVKKDDVKIRTNDFKEKKETLKEVSKEKNKPKDPFQKYKKKRNENIVKWTLVISNLIVFIISPTWGFITAPITLSLVGCLLYPKWIREGYLNTPYLKIAVFVAAFGGLIANLWWLFLFLGI